MRNVEVIDKELRDLVSLRWLLRECNAKASSHAEVVGHVDELLDERNGSFDRSA